MKTFQELGVSPSICKAVEEMGFEYPMPVQEQVIPYLLEGTHDLVALAQTGTGKTAAFGLPLLDRIDPQGRLPQDLILCPTRELCLQIAGDLKDYAKYIPQVSILPVYGGTSILNQIHALKNGVQILVATPGRLLDLINRGAVSLSNVSNVVMDEADEMLDMGFSEDINAILETVPEQRHTLLFSATMSDEIQKIASNYLHEPVEITIGKRNEGTHSVRHEVYCVHAKDKYEVLKRIVDYHPDIYAIIFCRTRVETQQIAEQLMNDGYNADALHGELSQAQRDQVMQKFRIRHLQILVATDVAARGLDVDDLTHVINYALPDDTEYYTHRSGRTGRAGKTGVSIAIINMKEKGRLREIERVIGQKFLPGQVPTNKEICSKQLISVVSNLEMAQVNEEEIQDFMPQVLSKLEWLDREEIIKRFVSLEFNRFLDYYRGRSDVESTWDQPREKRAQESRQKNGSKKWDHTAEPGFTRLFINMGKIDNFFPKDLIGLLNRCCQKRRVEVGRIDLLKTFSFFEVPDADADFVIHALSHAQLFGRYISVEKAEKDDKQAHDGKAEERPRQRDHAQKSAGLRPERNKGQEAQDYQKPWKEEKPHREEKPWRGEKPRKDEKPKKKEKPSRQERGYDKPRGRKDDWKQFFQHNDDLT